MQSSEEHLAVVREEKHLESRETVEKAIHFIEDNLSENLSVDDISAFICRDPGYFSKIFKHTMGTTPHAYLNNRRISYAKELLWTTNHTVEVISSKSGFINTASFYRAFKRITGTTPRQFRKL